MEKCICLLRKDQLLLQWQFINTTQIAFILTTVQEVINILRLFAHA